MSLNEEGGGFGLVFVVDGDFVEVVVVATVISELVIGIIISFLPAWLLLVELLVISLPQTGEWERWVTEAVQKCVHPSAVPSSAGCNVCISDSFQFSLEVEL